MNIPAVSSSQFSGLAKSILMRLQLGTMPDYFVPTPNLLVDWMLVNAGMRKRDIVLEPSAGQGHIADRIKKYVPESQIHVVEPDPDLQRCLQDKGYTLVSKNILEYKPERPLYTKIIMNPPFGKGMDILHVLHCFNNLLKPGGTLVAILPEKCFLPSNIPPKKEWLNNTTGNEFNEDLRRLMNSKNVRVAKTYVLHKGEFLQSDIPNPVDTRILLLTKKNRFGLYNTFLKA